MRTFALRTLREFWESGHAPAAAPLREWYAKTEKANWTKFADVRATFASADAVGDKVIFNIHKNAYRLIVTINYEFGGVLVKWVGIHAEYDRLVKDQNWHEKL